MNVEGLVKALHLEDFGAIMQLLFQAYLCSCRSCFSKNVKHSKSYLFYFCVFKNMKHKH